MDILKLVDEGERLGLRGQELRDFVGAQQERERVSRALAREIAKQNYDREWENAVRERLMAKESYDREGNNSDRERENFDRERLIAREKFDRENDERERERSKQKAEFEIEMQLLEKQIELERMKANNNNRNASYETLGANQKSMLDLAMNYERAHKYVGYEEAQPVSNQGGMRKCSNIPRYRHPQSNRHYRCKKVGHRANECRQTNNKPSQRDYHLTNSHGIANAGVTSLTHVCSIYESEAQLRCGCSVPVLGNACVDYQPDIPTPTGYVNTEVERVLRDTGCSDEVNQGAELQCRDTTSTEIEEVQTSTNDACEEVQTSTNDACEEVQTSMNDACEEVQTSTSDACEEVQTSMNDACEEVQTSTSDAYEEETYVYTYTYDDIDSDQFESDDEVIPDNVDMEESDTMVETCVSENQSRDSVTFKPLPVHKHCYVSTSHRYLCSPFKEGGLRVMRQLWEKERIT